jgi:hypothetical protein
VALGHHLPHGNLDPAPWGRDLRVL